MSHKDFWMILSSCFQGRPGNSVRIQRDTSFQSINIQKTNRVENKRQKRQTCRTVRHSKTHTHFIYTPDTQGQKLIHLPLKPSQMEKCNIWLWADKRFQRRSEKTTLTSVRLIFHLISHHRKKDTLFSNPNAACERWAEIYLCVSFTSRTQLILF